MNERQTRVRKVLLDHANSEFKYGTLDCVLFQTHVIHAITGVDHALGFNYRSESGAKKILARYQGLEGLFTAYLGEPADIRKLEDGDPVLLELPVIGDVMGMMVSDSVMVKTEHGVITMSTNLIKRGWHICLVQ